MASVRVELRAALVMCLGTSCQRCEETAAFAILRSVLQYVSPRSMAVTPAEVELAI